MKCLDMSDKDNNYSFYDYHPALDNFKEDVLASLSSCPRTLSPKYFYDQEGSKIFERITCLDDYYPTRCELSIFAAKADEIARSTGSNCVLIEPGAGNGDKARILIKILNPSIYVPIDISRQHLIEAAQAIAMDCPAVNIAAVCSDFTGEIQLPGELPQSNRVMFFPGSSIGNFHPDNAVEYLAKLATLAGSHGKLLIGVDLKKDVDILQRAYDDSEGVTAQFNLNLLVRMNRELSADFDINTWQHVALYNEAQGRVEMHLRSLCPQVVTMADCEFYFEENEAIHTENSYKYTVDEFKALAKRAGFNSLNVWLDENKYFSLHLFECS